MYLDVGSQGFGRRKSATGKLAKKNSCWKKYTPCCTETFLVIIESTDLILPAINL